MFAFARLTKTLFDSSRNGSKSAFQQEHRKGFVRGYNEGESALKLLSTALNKQGLQKVQEIMEADEAYKALAGGGNGRPMGRPPGGGQPNFPPGGRRPGNRPLGGGMSPGFGRDNYYLAFFGALSLNEPWMIQFGSHHLAINLTMGGKSNVLTPTLTGSQPATYKLDGETVRPLGRENDKRFALINSLDAAQQKQAILNYQISDLVLGAGEDGKTIQPEDIKVSPLNAAQKEKLLDVSGEWVGILNDEAAAVKIAEIKANFSETWFAWSGPTALGSAALLPYSYSSNIRRSGCAAPAVLIPTTRTRFTATPVNIAVLILVK